MSFTEAQKARIVAKYVRTESVIETQRWTHANMRKTAAYRETILRMHARFL